MANWPADVTLCELVIDEGLSSTGIELDTFVTVNLVLQGTNRLIWHDGTEFLPLPDRLRNTASILVPVTDQQWRDGSGNTYTGFAYEVTVTRQRVADRNTYTVPVQPVTGQTSIVVSELNDGTIGTPVIVPTVGLTLEQINQALLIPHLQSVTPHEAYDTDLPQLSVLFENVIS